MKVITRILTVSSVAALLAGCGGGTNGGVAPSTTQANLATNVLQLAVGTAYNAADNATGLNVVTTFRQSNGLSAVLADTPSITGPAGFTVPAGFPGAYSGTNTDAGTNTISASPQVPVNTTAKNTTLGTFTGAFSYGLAPLNTDQLTNAVGGYYPGNPNNTPGNGFTSSNYSGGPFWPQPFGATTQGTFLIGPPAVPSFTGPQFPAGFAGYSPGFTAFQLTPVAGTYTENVAVTASNAPSQSFTATAALNSLTPLPAPVVSGVTADGKGGLSGTVTVGAGVTETLVFVEDTNSGAFYTVEVMGTGAQPFAIPDSSGAKKGDPAVVTAVSFDYPALEAGPPANTSQKPTIVGAGGQADLSIGVPVSGKTVTF